jgi:selenocysteine lyase/cysteine desulfurase
MPRQAADAARRYLDHKTTGVFPPDEPIFGPMTTARRSFARLINADPLDVAIVQSTSMGENLIVSGLGIPGGAGNVVTDALHHEGTLYLYRSIATADLEIRVARPRDWRIDPADLDKLIDARTRLVAISLVSWVNGFQHDLKTICEIAHRKGALVYVDLVQGAGVVPVDVKAANVDFCACGGYKWLMGDAGAGFLYVRPDLLGTVVKRPQWGFLQMRHFDYHAFPGDEPGDYPLSFERQPGAAGFFEVGTPSFSALAATRVSIDYLLDLGLDRIGAHIRPLVEQLQDEAPKLGFTPITPRESRSGIAAFLVPDPDLVRQRLKAADIEARLWGRQLRVSPAIHNRQTDIDAILRALAG